MHEYLEALGYESMSHEAPSPLATPSVTPEASRNAVAYKDSARFEKSGIREASKIVAKESAAEAQSAERPALAGLGWDELKSCAMNCRSCKLAGHRKNVVFDDGNRDSPLMFVGEGPGEEEDRQGLPFVGQAGQLLNKMIQAMGLGRDRVYIANVVKCRPPENRNPDRDEIAACGDFLKRQIELVRPRVIVALGTFAAQSLLASTQPIGKLRGEFHALEFVEGLETRVMPTYHPAFLLRNPNMKKPVWEDLQKVMGVLGLKQD
jgi:DNA polymerase